MKRMYLFICVFFSLFLTGCGTKTVDLMSYATVNFSGIDGRGKADLSVNWGDFEDAVASTEDKQEMAGYAKIVALESSIDFSVDKSEGLSNGDKVTISVVWNKDTAKQYKLKFIGESKSVTVSDLLIPKEIDVFNDVKLEFKGVSQKAKLTIINESADQFVKGISYKASAYENIANGDEIVITADYTEKDAEESGYIVKNNEKTYIASGVGEYITSYDEIDSDTLEEIKEQGIEFVKNKVYDVLYNAMDYLYPDGDAPYLNLGGIKVASIDLKTSYFQTVKEDISLENQADFEKDYFYNYLYLIYEVKFSDNISNERISYLPVRYTNIILNGNGTIDFMENDVNISSAKSKDYNNVYKNIITIREDKFNYKVIEY